MKSGNLNFLEPSGPLQAYNGTDLPLPYPLYVVLVWPYVYSFPICVKLGLRHIFRNVTVLQVGGVSVYN